MYDFNLETHIWLMQSGDEDHMLIGGRNDSSVIFSQVLKAIGFLHHKGIVHCNIQSRNIYIADGELNSVYIK